MRKTFKFKLYPSKKQIEALKFQLSEARFLYNSALRERRDAWIISRKSLNYYDQANQLKEIRADGDLELANFSACQDILRRVDKTFRRFFAGVKRGEKAGFPRFKAENRFDSFTFPSYNDGCKLKPNGKIYLQGVGDVKVKLHRPITGKIKTVTIKRNCGKWFICFSVEYESQPLPEVDTEIGIDVGIKEFATYTGDREPTPNPRFFERLQKHLRRAQRSVSRKKKGRNNRKKAVLKLRKIYQKIKNCRNNFHHQLSAEIVKENGTIVVEDLNIKGLARTRIAKQVLDAGWSGFLSKLAYKAEEAGRRFVKVNPRGTSQNCSACGEKVPKSLKVRVHCCSNCGLVLDRDKNASQNILRLGLSRLAQTKPVGV